MTSFMNWLFTCQNPKAFRFPKRRKRSSWRRFNVRLTAAGGDKAAGTGGAMCQSELGGSDGVVTLSRLGISCRPCVRQRNAFALILRWCVLSISSTMMLIGSFLV